MQQVREAAQAFATPQRKLPVLCPARGRRRPTRQTRMRKPCLENESRVRRTPRVLRLEDCPDRPPPGQYRGRLSPETQCPRSYLVRAKFRTEAYPENWCFFVIFSLEQCAATFEHQRVTPDAIQHGDSFAPANLAKA